MNAVSAVFFRDYRLRRGNPFLLFWDVAAPLAYLVLFGIGYEQMMGAGLSIDGQSFKYTAFLVPGVLGLVTFSIAVNTSWNFFMDKDSGIAEEMLTYPLTRYQILFGKLAFNVALALFSSTLVLAAGAWFLGAPIRWEWMPLMLIVTVFAQSASFFIFHVVAVKINQMDAYNAVVGVMYVLMMFLSSMFYSLANMPIAFQAVSYLNPMTWQIDLLRFCLLGVGDRTPLLMEGAALVVFTAACLAVALLSTRRGS
jgi:ABC-2 type transport system permease protein